MEGEGKKMEMTPELLAYLTPEEREAWEDSNSVAVNVLEKLAEMRRKVQELEGKMQWISANLCEKHLNLVTCSSGPCGYCEAEAAERKVADLERERLVDSGTMMHTMNCPALTPGNDDECRCGLEWRIKLRTEQEMHAAWRKRTHEAEAEVERLLEQNGKLHDALERIAAYDEECGCDHSTEDCCYKQRVNCPRCWAGIALTRPTGEARGGR